MLIVPLFLPSQIFPAEIIIVLVLMNFSFSPSHTYIFETASDLISRSLLVLSSSRIRFLEVCWELEED